MSDDPVENIKKLFTALSDKELALVKSLFTGVGVDEAVAALQDDDDDDDDEYTESEDSEVDDYYDFGPDEWVPSCEMDCELCGCHGDCADCGTYVEYDDYYDS